MNSRSFQKSKLLSDGKNKTMRSVMLNESQQPNQINEFDCNEDDCQIKKSLFTSTTKSLKSHHQKNNSKSMDRLSKINSPKNHGSTSQIGNKKAKRYNMPSQSCQQEKSELRHQILHLQEKIDDQGEELVKMRKQLKEEMVENENLTFQVNKSLDSKELEKIVQEQKYQIYNLKSRELQLCEELQEQQLISKEALTKLFDLKENHQEEKEQLVKLFEEREADIVQEEIEPLQKQIGLLELTIEDQKGVIRQLESQVNQYRIKENFRSQSPPKATYRSDYKSLQQEQLLRSKLSDVEKRQQNLSAAHDENMREQVEKLRLELLQKEQAIQEREQFYKKQLSKLEDQYEEKLNESISANHISKLYEKQKDLLRQSQEEDEKKRYKSRPNNQKNGGWQDNFKDLVKQIKNLKYEIDDMKDNNMRIIQSGSPYEKQY